MFFFRRLRYAISNFWNAFKATDTLTEYLTPEEINLILKAEMHTRCPCCSLNGWKLNADIFRIATRNIHAGKSVYMMTCYNCNFILFRQYLGVHNLMTRKNFSEFITSTKSHKNFKLYLVNKSDKTNV